MQEGCGETYGLTKAGHSLARSIHANLPSAWRFQYQHERESYDRKHFNNNNKKTKPNIKKKIGNTVLLWVCQSTSTGCPEVVVSILVGTQKPSGHGAERPALGGLAWVGGGNRLPEVLSNFNHSVIMQKSSSTLSDAAGLQMARIYILIVQESNLVELPLLTSHRLLSRKEVFNVCIRLSFWHWHQHLWRSSSHTMPQEWGLFESRLMAPTGHVKLQVWIKKLFSLHSHFSTSTVTPLELPIPLDLGRKDFYSSKTKQRRALQAQGSVMLGGEFFSFQS